ncbi:MAG: T9SS type A sorting domain-containing protein [Cyclobacteriaceae bacterium]
MKKVVKFMAVLLIVFGTVVASASIDSASATAYCKVVTLENEKSFRVLYQGYQSEDVQVQLINEQGKVMYQEMMKNTQEFAKSYDISQLPDGAYQVEVTSGGIVYEEQFSISSWNAHNIKIISNQQEGKIALMGQNDSGDYLKVYILDDQGQILFKEKLEKGQDIGKLYNVQQVDSKHISLLLYNGNEVVKEAIVKL